MIYTFGDGYASGHIWPEWPQLLEAISHQAVENFGHIGAGNEYIFNCAVKSALTARPSDIFLIQWSKPDRFDKIVQDEIWQKLHMSDEKYKNIESKIFHQSWWATSASTLKEIQHYNKFYIQEEQAINRSVLYMISLSKMLKSLNITHYYFQTYTINYSNHSNYTDLLSLPWIEFSGMAEWAKLHPLRGNEIQPAPIVHFDWLVEKLLPKLNIIIDEEKRLALTQKLRNFVPYHYDRKQIWENLKNEISVLLK
jgi:hypothetical protein